MTLGKKIRTLRAEHNLSQPELAEKIGIEQSYLSKLENDKSVPSNDIFNNMLVAFGLTLEQFVSGFSQGTELERIRQIPDVDHYFSNQRKHNQNNQRRFLYLSSLLIVLATTLFYVGYSKQLFSERQFQYESKIVILDNEPVDILTRWRTYLMPSEERDYELIALKKMEMAKRTDAKIISVFEHAGPYFRLDVEGGYRHYRLTKEIQVKRAVNAWLQVFGVFLFSTGIMGFVLERRLFKSAL
jgi:transcriptional regulator with XRE-family HTH domain